MTKEDFEEALVHHSDMIIKMAYGIKNTLYDPDAPIQHVEELVDIPAKLMIAHLNAVEHLVKILPTYYP